MQAIVGQEARFDHGREEMKVLAGLEVTTKSVERTAEAIGADIAQREQAEIQKALQLELPVVAGEPLHVLYVQMDGTGVPVVKKETVGRGANAILAHRCCHLNGAFEDYWDERMAASLPLVSRAPIH